MNSESTRDLTAYLNGDQVRDHLTAFLYAVGLVKDNEEVELLKFDLADLNKEVIPVHLKLREERSVRLQVLNG